jgi:hypothetical protein
LKTLHIEKDSGNRAKVSAVLKTAKSRVSRFCLFYTFLRIIIATKICVFMLRLYASPLIVLLDRIVVFCALNDIPKALAKAEYCTVFVFSGIAKRTLRMIDFEHVINLSTYHPRLPFFTFISHL